MDLSAIASNLRALASRAGGRPIWAVVKADAYGHGAAAVSNRLAREGVRAFAVANLDEGLALRRAGIPGEILILAGVAPEEAAACRAYGLTPAIGDAENVRAIARAVGRRDEPLAVHVKLDTGMRRLGAPPEALPGLVAALAASRGELRVAGAFTQLSAGEEEGAEPTRGQLELLRAGLAALGSAGISPEVVHAANSGAILRHPDARCDAVRPGLALYGVLPAEGMADPGLTPALSLETRVLEVRDVPPGARVGYGGAWTARRATRIATLPIGYHDGLRRSLSGKFAVRLRGGWAPVVGMVSMDLTLVDATDTGAAAGDRAVVIGRDGDAAISAWDVARAADTIPWEILCTISPRVPRIYVDG